MMTKQIVDHFKIRSVSDGSARGGAPREVKKNTCSWVKSSAPWS